MLSTPSLIKPRRPLPSLRTCACVPALALFGAACAYAIYIHFTSRVLPYDDAFITFRYVDNLFKGHGLVYNTGQRVFGSSTPLYVVWLIFLKTLVRGGELPNLAVRCNVLFYLASGFGFLFLFRKLLGGIAAGALAAALFLVRYDMLKVSIGGNEAFMFCGLVLWAFYFLVDEKYVLSGFLAGLSIMARPEGVFCAFLVGLVWLLHNRKKPVLFLASGVIPGLLWTVFAFAYYGTPIYHSLISKSQPLYPFPPGHAFRAIFSTLGSWTPGAWGRGYVVVAELCAAVIGFVVRRRAHRRTWFVVPSFLGLVLAFYGVSNPYVFPWYLPVVFLGWYVLLMAGIAYLISESAEYLNHRFRFKEREVLISMVAVTLPLLILARSAWSTWEDNKIRMLSLRLAHDSELRIETYRSAAELINRVGEPSDTIAAPEVGSLGFYSVHHIYDACGLVSPEAIPYLPAPRGEETGPAIAPISGDFARAVNADWIVTMEVFALDSLVNDPWFIENYVLFEKIPLEMETFRSKYVWVYRHR